MSDNSLIYGKVFRAKIDPDVFDIEKEIYDYYEINDDRSYNGRWSGKDWIMFFDEITSLISSDYGLFIPDFRKFNERAHALNKMDGINIDLNSGLKFIEYYYNGADPEHVEFETYEDFKKMKR